MDVDAGVPSHVGSAARRTSRVVAVICAVGSILYVTVMSPTLISQWSMFAPWWLAFAGVVFVALPIGAIVAAVFDRAVLGRRLVRVWAPLIPLSVLVMPLALVFGSIPESLHSPWVLHATLVAGAVSAAAWPNLVGFALTAATAACVVVARIGARSDDILTIAILDGVVALSTGLIIATLIAATIRASASLDAVALDVREQSVALAAADAVTDERTRIIGDVHDGVLAVLLGAARARAGSISAVAADARRILARAAAVDRLSLEIGDAELVRRLRVGVSTLAPDVEIIAGGGPTGMRLPIEVADAVVDATIEAVRNSIRHAGGGLVHRRVEIAPDSGGIAVRIVDDGVGFYPDDVDPRRLGLSASILGRLAAVDGGSAAVTASPGGGTGIDLRWRRPAAAASVPAKARSGSHSSDLSRQLGFGTPGAVAILVLFLAAQTALAAWLVTLHPIRTVLALLLIAVAGALVVARGRFPMGRLRTGLVITVPAIAVAIGLSVVDPNAAGGFAGWSIGAAFIVLLGACLQGRPGMASAGAIGVVLVVLAWQATGGSIAAAPGLVVREVALFAVGAVFTFQFRRTARVLADLSDRRTRIAVDRARAEARADVRRREFDPLIEAARAALDRIATGVPLTDGERSETGMLEARLRDRMRAPALAGGSVGGAVDAARRAGVDVLLIDDSGLDAIGDAPSATIARAITDSAPASGTMTVRLAAETDGLRLSIATDDGIDVTTIRSVP